MALSSLGTFKKNTTTKFSIKFVFKNFDEALCLLLFHQRLRLNPLHQGGLVHPVDVNKSHSAKKNRTNLTPLNYSCDWSIIKEKRKQKNPPKKLTTVPPGPWGPLGPGGPGGPCKAFICITNSASLKTYSSFCSQVFAHGWEKKKSNLYRQNPHKHPSLYDADKANKTNGSLATREKCSKKKYSIIYSN